MGRAKTVAREREQRKIETTEKRVGGRQQYPCG